MLSFRLAWNKGDVAQVNRGDLELILAEEPARAGSGRLFVERSATTTRRLPRGELS